MFDLFKRKSAAEPAEAGEKKSWTERLKDGLARSREKLAGALSRRTLDDETLEELETALITADVGMPATRALLDDLSARWKRAGGDAEPKTLLKAALLELLAPLEQPLDDHRRAAVRDHDRRRQRRGQDDLDRQARQAPAAQGLSVLLAAGDTFRAAAREQLTVWGERNNVAGDRAAERRPGRRRCSTRSPRPGRAASTSCSPTPPAGCRRSCT